MKLVYGVSLAILVLSMYVSNVNGGAVTTGAPQNPNVPGGECVRMFHSKGDVGCFSLDKDGSRARLVAIASAEDFSGGKLQQESIVILPDSLFTKENINKLNGKYIKGILIYPSSTPNKFNYEATSPQGKDTVDGVLNPLFGDYAWNPQGRGIASTRLPYPVLEVESEEKAKQFLDLAAKNEKTPIDSTFGVVYKGVMDYYFGPEKMDSKGCLNFKNIYGERSPKCLPVGGQSAWGVKGDLTSSKSIVLATAAMDTNSFSHVFAPGANAGASGVVALLAAADALKSVPSSSLKKNILFAAFQGESYGFVGSRRFLDDIKAKFTCKKSVTANTPFGTSLCASPIRSSLAFTDITLGKIDTAIAIDQVGGDADALYLHVNPKADNKPLEDALSKAPSAKNRVKKSSVKDSIPPGPLVSFLNDKEYGTSTLVSAVLSGYDDAFPATYHSRGDTNSTIKADNVVQAAQVLAETLFVAAGGADLPSSVKVNSTLVSKLLACITSDWTCDVMQAYAKPSIASMNDYLQFTDNSYPSFMQPVTLYTGVYSENRMPTIRVNKSAVLSDLSGDLAWQNEYKLNLYPNAYETFTRAFLAASVSEIPSESKTCTKNKDCTDENLECVYPGVCARRSAYFHDALSPGLKRETTYGLYTIINESMPLWTEPNWGTLGTYLFPDPGSTIGYLTLGSGALSIGLGYFLASRFLAHFRKQKLL